MRVFIFRGVEQLTDNYHSGGGLVAFADSKEHVEKLVAEHNDAYGGPLYAGSSFLVLEEDDWDNVIVRELYSATEPVLYVFPDAGCC